jgi:tetratricopeptide (TPR) repeat protein
MRLGLGLGAAAIVVVGAAGGWALMASRAAAIDPRAIALNNEGMDSLRLGRYEAAGARFEAALQRSRRYGEAKVNLATVVAQRGDVNRAASLLGEVIADPTRDPALRAKAYYGLAEIDMRDSSWAHAAEQLQRAAALDSSRAEYLNNLGFALLQAGRTDEAIATLREARRRFPGEPALLKNLALAWLRRGTADSALAAADAAIDLRPDYAAAWLAKIRAEVRLGQATSARGSLSALRALRPDPHVLEEAEAVVGKNR